MKKVALSVKKRPLQSRSHDTFELIVETSGRLLEEVGFEQLTTNLVCREAGLTPPALYRYFPNKYAILKELGNRLMKAQDDAALAWLGRDGLVGETFEARVKRAIAAQREVISVTRNFPGSIAITRALRAIPILNDIRINSRNSVANHHAIALARIYPHIEADALLTCSKLCIEMLYAAMEAVLEGPESEREAFIEGICRAVVLYIDDLDQQYKPDTKRPQ